MPLNRETIETEKQQDKNRAPARKAKKMPTFMAAAFFLLTHQKTTYKIPPHLK